MCGEDSSIAVLNLSGLFREGLAEALPFIFGRFFAQGTANIFNRKDTLLATALKQLCNDWIVATFPNRAATTHPRVGFDGLERGTHFEIGEQSIRRVKRYLFAKVWAINSVDAMSGSRCEMFSQKIER